MTLRVTFYIVAFFIAIALLLIIINTATGNGASAENAVSSIASLVTAVGGLVTALQGAAKEPGRKATSFEPVSHQGGAPPFSINRSFETGIYGGLFGGVVAGTGLALAYNSSAAAALRINGISPVRIFADIFVTACLTGILIGAATLFGSQYFRYRGTYKRRPKLIYNEIVGGAVFGAVAGAVSGAIVAWIFAPRPVPAIQSGLLIAAAVIAAIAIPAGTLLYDFRGELRLLVRAFLICSVGTALLLIPASSILLRFDVFAWFYSHNPARYGAAGGLIGGMMIAAVGAEIGATLTLHRLWLRAESIAKSQQANVVGTSFEPGV